MKPKILLIEDNEGTRFGFVRYFSKEGYLVSEAANLAEAVAATAAERFDAIILDINLPDGNGLDFIDSIRTSDLTIPIIVITGAGDVPLAVNAMARGADNFLTKPVDNYALAVYLRKTLEVGDLKKRQLARQRLEPKEDIFFGQTPVMQEVQNIARIAATCDNPVLIIGETGTGKGMLAKWIHHYGKRTQKEFVEVNCSGLRGELLAREIFGNARGAFTSADQDRKGLLDIADRGTLFLDEIGDMGIDVQAQFLKVLEDKSYRRLGDVKLLRSDFRLLCATNQDIEDMVRKGRFRQDLFFRINLIIIHIPPLRERMKDLPGLVSYLLDGFGTSGKVITDDVMGILKDYDWPGNIRELKNVLERALLLSPRGAILRQSNFANLRVGRSAVNMPAPRTVQEIEQSHILTVLEQMNGDVDKTARALNLSRATLYRRLKSIREKSA